MLPITGFAAELNARIESLPPETVSERFRMVMVNTLEASMPHRQGLGRLFAAGLQSDESDGFFGEESAALRTVMQQSFTRLVGESTDRPARPDQTFALGTLLFALNLLMLIIWLYDRTPQQRATRTLLDFTCDALKMVRSLMIMPLVTQSILRLSDVLLAVLGLTPLAAPLPQSTSQD